MATTTTTMSMDQALGTLIRMGNPYTDGKPGSILVGNPTPGSTPDSPVDPIQIRIEEDNYEGQWAFKGQTQTVKKALRITYCYPKKDKSGTILYYVTEHLLIGYAGSNGG